jgi:hypothetical protein
MVRRVSEACAGAGDQQSRLHDGWRGALRAAEFVLMNMEGEANTTAGRSALAAARTRIAALPPPPEAAIPPRDERLAAAIRSALALLKAQHPDEAAAVLTGAIP